MLKVETVLINNFRHQQCKARVVKDKELVWDNLLLKDSHFKQLLVIRQIAEMLERAQYQQWQESNLPRPPRSQWWTPLLLRMLIKVLISIMQQWKRERTIIRQQRKEVMALSIWLLWIIIAWCIRPIIKMVKTTVTEESKVKDLQQEMVTLEFSSEEST